MCARLCRSCLHVFAVVMRDSMHWVGVCSGCVALSGDVLQGGVSWDVGIRVVYCCFLCA